MKPKFTDRHRYLRSYVRSESTDVARAPKLASEQTLRLDAAKIVAK
jgi:hypothetical protein